MRYPCHVDPEQWFDKKKSVRDMAAQACQNCPIMKACESGALERREVHGVWGGRDFDGMRYPSKTIPPRQCEECSAEYLPPSNVSAADFRKRRFCSQTCANRWGHRARTAERQAS